MIKLMKALILGLLILFATNNGFGVSYTVDVTATGMTDYTFSGDFTGQDPAIGIKIGDTLIFNVNAPYHPFWLKTIAGIGTGDSLPVSNNGTGSGTIIWVPTEVGTYYYNCELHEDMTGSISVSSYMKKSHVWVRNNGSTPVTLIVERTVSMISNGLVYNDSTPGSSVNFFCWGSCYPPQVSISGESVSIDAGATDKISFEADYEIKGGASLNDTAQITYCFIDDCNPSNVQCFTALYCLASPSDSTYQIIGFDTSWCLVDTGSGTAIENIEHLFEEPSLNISPNPAKEVLNLVYSLGSRDGEGDFILRNMLGAIVSKKKLYGPTGKIAVPVTKLNRGVYFYSLVLDQKIYSTKKLIIDN